MEPKLTNTPYPAYPVKMHSKRMPAGNGMGLVESARKYISQSKRNK